MPFQNLIKHYKGGTGSGDWGHRGRPGKRGGSGGGGGKFVVPSSNYMLANHSPDCGPVNPPPGCNELHEYTRAISGRINGLLRDPQFTADVVLKKIINRDVEAIDKRFAKAKPLEKSITVRRGMVAGILDDMAPGDMFRDDGYTSTTITSPSHSVMMGDWMGTWDVTLNINIPKGLKGLYLEKISNFPDEREFLLPRGSEFLVDDKRTMPNGKIEFDITMMD